MLNSFELDITRLACYPLLCVFSLGSNTLPNSLSMAEVVGTFASVVTIAALFKACVDAFDLVQSARHQEADYNRLLLKFNIEKCRLYTWGQMMRLASAVSPNESRPLDDFQFRDVAIRILQTLYALFNDSQKFQERYGCGKAPVSGIAGSDEAQLMRPLADAFLHFPTAPHNVEDLSIGRKTRWVIRDRKKFAGLVSEIKDLVDGLQEITKSIAPIGLQESAMTSRITAVADVETLQSLSETCEEDYPLFSQAASLKSEALSMGEARRVEIEAWLVDGTQPLDPDITDLENMDLPELKHHIVSVLKQKQQLKDDYNNVFLLSIIGRARLDESLKSKENQAAIVLRLFVVLMLYYWPRLIIGPIMGMYQFQVDFLNRKDLWAILWMYWLDWLHWVMAIPIMVYTITTFCIIYLETRKETTPEDRNHYPRHLVSQEAFLWETFSSIKATTRAIFRR